MYQSEYGKVGTPEVLVDDLTAALTRAIEELTRPVDAIKHQAKTVTVGISRSDEGLLDSRLVQEVLAAGAGRDRLSYRTLKALAELDPGGGGRDRLHPLPHRGRPRGGEAHISIVDRGGLAREVAVAGRAQPGAARHQAAGRLRQARCWWPGAAPTAARC